MLIRINRKVPFWEFPSQRPFGKWSSVRCVPSIVLRTPLLCVLSGTSTCNSMNLLCLLSLVSTDPGLKSLQLQDLERFLGLARRLKRTISYCQPSFIHTPPETLPTSVQSFLTRCLLLPDETVKHFWAAFKSEIWSSTEDLTMRQAERGEQGERGDSIYLPDFLRNGPSEGLGTQTAGL